ncbi:phosphatidate cytidylyltransferase [Stratiformator vulcanicus]|uniref:Phosphatidate cytidylyltransferase n=1 Tax=Stratiformator vulcanicus TaxID=2527980 RepID=A0A517R044_9PLAN|nr:phosphatidate cytidylyltransferase [Stratiformator vulcanicus]QDT37194.1 Phosphatidate cytidylyltransferase [Stratiformator vulcanicus]
MLGRRLLVSALLIPGAIGLFVLDAYLGPTAPILYLLAISVAVRMVWELAGLLRSEQPSVTLSNLCVVGLITAHWIPHFLAGEEGLSRSLSEAMGPSALAYTLCLLVILSRRAFVYREPTGHLATLGAETLILSYAGMLICATTQLRWVAGADLGYLALGSLVIATKAGDIAGYAFGRAFGRSKLAPRLSPGKTKTGAVWAIVASSIATAAWLHWATPLFSADAALGPWWLLLIYGAVVGLAGIAGDLCESVLKRAAGKKDAADLMPGFGGLLDLIDSPLYAGPVALFCWEFLPIVN